jgi:hypothetical protein
MFDRFDRIEKHYDVENQAVPNPQKQNYFHQNKEDKREPKANFVSEPKPKAEAQNIAERIDDRIAEVIERDRRLAVALDYGIRIFRDFPRAFDRDRDQQAPRERHFSKDQRSYPEKQNAVKNVRERVRIEDVLRVVRAPNFPRPRRVIARLAPPNSTEKTKRKSRGNDNRENQSPGQIIVCRIKSEKAIWVVFIAQAILDIL